MPKRGKKAQSPIKFEYPITIEVHPVQFELASSLALLDPTRLSRGNHKIEVGWVKGGCCRKVVRAVIRKGMVAAVEVERCAEMRPVTPEIAGVLREARRRTNGGNGKFEPIPISDFLEAPEQVAEERFCVTICAFGWCYQCCSAPFGKGTITVCGGFPRAALL